MTAVLRSPVKFTGRTQTRRTSPQTITSIKPKRIYPIDVSFRRGIELVTDARSGTLYC